jgi:hypothetical protein
MTRTLRLGAALGLGAALALANPSAQAADSQSRYAAHGLGLLPCKRFVEFCEKGAPQCELTSTWVTGYVTAFNALSEDTFDILTWQTPELVAQGAFNFCQRNPDAALVEGVTAVMRVLHPQRIEAAADRVRIGEGKNAAYLYRATVRELQQRLIDAGHLKGAADGAFGPGTKAAVEAFQKSAGLEVNGIPDQRTLIALFYERAAGQQQGQAGEATSPAAQASAPKSSAPAARQPAAPRLDLNLAPNPN